MVGVFDRTPDGDLMLVDHSFCSPLECGAEAVRIQFPELIAGGRLVVAPPAHRTLLKGIAVPPVTGAPRARVIGFEAEQMVGGGLAEAVWAHVPVSPGVPECAVVMAMKLAAAEELCAAVARGGPAVDRVVPAGWALVRALRHNYPELTRPAVVVWLAGRTALLVRVERTAVALRQVALPEVVRAAEPAPARQGTMPEEGPEEPVVPGNAPWVDRVAVELARLAGGTRTSGTETAAIEVFLGGDASVGPEAVAALATRVTVPVAGFDALRRVRLAPGIRGSDTMALQLGVVVGLALEALAGGTVNLLPPVRQREIRFRRRRGGWLAAAAAAVVLTLVSLLWLRQERLALRLEESVVAARLVPQRVAERGRKDGERERALLVQQLDALAALRAARTGWLEWFADLQERLTAVGEVWFDSLALRPSAVVTAAGGGRGGLRHPVALAGAEGPAAALRIAVTGGVLHREGTDPLGRVRRLRASLLASRFVAAVEDERFDDTQPGLLRFSCTLVMKPEVAL